MLWSMGTPVAGVPSPPGLDQRGGLHGAGAQGGFGESLKSRSFQPLPAPGAEGASLAFGDSLALAGPQMSDIGATSRDWWLFVLQQAEAFYERWLVAGPVDRLRLTSWGCSSSCGFPAG